jgi:hypothetical protein
MAFDPITAVSNVVNLVLERVLPDKVAKDAAKAALTQMVEKGEIDTILGQQAINVVEAGSMSIFVAGWRPFVGWVCGSALAYHYIMQPFLVMMISYWHTPLVLPTLEMGELMTLLLGILGLGAYRSYDKKANGGGKQG